MATVAVGLIVGAGAAVVLTRLIRGLLWGITPTDPLTFALVLLGFLLTGLLACFIPAHRATRIDPVEALRH